MRISCPGCGATISLDLAITHDNARDAVLAALKLPRSLAAVLLQYLSLFRPEKRALTMDRVAVLLGELLVMINAGTIERDGKTHAIALKCWQQGLTEMVERNKTKPFNRPLKSHGYLFEVLIAAAASEAGRLEAKLEAQRQQPSAAEQAQRRQPASPEHIQQNINNMKAALGMGVPRPEPTISMAELIAMAEAKEQERLQQIATNQDAINRASTENLPGKNNDN